MIDIVYFEKHVPNGIFYNFNQPKFGYTLNLGDFVRYHFEHRLVNIPNYANDTYVFMAICSPDNLHQINISQLIKTLPDSFKLNITVSFPMETFFQKNIIEFIKSLLSRYQKANFFFSYGNANIDSTYIKEVLDRRVTYIPNPLFELHYTDYIKRNSTNVPEQKNLIKKFLIPIRQAKPFRMFIYVFAHKNGILENSYYSWTTENVYHCFSCLNEDNKWKFDKNEHMDLLTTRVVLDPSDNREMRLKQWDIPDHLISTSFLQLVCETTFNEGEEKAHPVIFLTEKTYKPIFYKQPFILFSEPHSLRYLKSMGYKTFSSIINEKYDEIEDSSLRMSLILTEIAKINKKSLEELTEIRKQINDIVEHNFNLLMSRPSEAVLINHIENTLFYGKQRNRTVIGQ
jgi:hypothetical protein